MEVVHLLDGKVEVEDTVEIEFGNGFTVTECYDTDNKLVALIFKRDDKQMTIAGKTLENFVDEYMPEMCL